MKKFFKKTLACVMVLMIMATIAPLSGIMVNAESEIYSGYCGYNLTWNLNTSTGELKITGSGDMWDWDYETYEEEPGWCDYYEYIEYVNISSGVTSIGDEAFWYCTAITTVTIPYGVTRIGDRAFSECEELRRATLPSTVKTIGEQAFEYCGLLENVTFPSGLKTIGAWAFYACNSLTSITIPSTVTSIGECAFATCENMVSFKVDSGNSYYSSDSYGVLFNKNKTTLIQYPLGNSLSVYTIPNGVTTLAYASFAFSQYLSELTIPKSVKTIDDFAFTYCLSLETIKYLGTKAEWQLIDLYEECSEDLENVTVYGYTAQNISSQTTTLKSIANTVNGPQLTWYSVSGASGYYVYRRVSGGSWSRIGTTTSTSYIDKTAKSGTTYIYTARAYNSTSTSKYQSGLTIKCLAAPAISSIQNSVDGPYFKWNTVSGASGYYVYRRLANGEWSKIGTTSSTSFKDKTAKSGTTYYYSLKAYSGSTASSWRAGTPLKFLTAPTISSIQNSVDGPYMKWNKVTGASGYYVYRRTGSGSWAKIATTASTSYRDTTAKSGTTYYYSIKSYSGSTTSSMRAGTPLKFLAAPKISSITNSVDGPYFKWNTVSGASGYYVYRRTSSGDWAKIGTTTGASYKDKTAKSGTTYYYSIKSYSGSTTSSMRAGTPIQFLSAPKINDISFYYDPDIGEYCEISWNSVAGADEYWVYYRTANTDWQMGGVIYGTSCIDAELDDGYTYYYTVRAVSNKSQSSLRPGVAYA